ncbi:hypothetical protein ACSVDA_04475 [Cytobacillus sp. Hm23]
MNIKEEFSTLIYFFEGYFNQSVSWNDLDELLMDFRESEREQLISLFLEEIQKLKQIYDNNDKKTWNEINVSVKENSMRYFRFDRAMEFLNQVKSVFNDKEVV